MDTKEKIVKDWLSRYTGKSLDSFGDYILLTNFQKYVIQFSEIMNSTIEGESSMMGSSTAENITIINFGIGSPNAALIMDLLIAINPQAVLFLGKCGGLKKRNEIGDLILPIGAIRGDGASKFGGRHDCHILPPRLHLHLRHEGGQRRVNLLEVGL